MATNDKEPRSVMSRNRGDNQVVSGARRVKHRQFPAVHRDTWPANPDESLGPSLDAQAAPKSTRTKRIPKEKSAKQKKSKEQWVGRPVSASHFTTATTAAAGAS